MHKSDVRQTSRGRVEWEADEVASFVSSKRRKGRELRKVIVFRNGNDTGVGEELTRARGDALRRRVSAGHAHGGMA